jgi:hypothetical protein
MLNFNPDPRQPYSYQNAINECRRVRASYKFVRYENGGIMLAINSPTYGWMLYRGTQCSGAPALQAIAGTM